MNASQDKIQGILENVLEESIPLVHKGIFTTQQLQQTMNQREKCQNNMLKTAYKLSDYLKAIQYEYSLQRTRRFRISQMSTSNPLFKKQSKTDFIIIKRIIKLWDRTTHKYKYSLNLWKQYLAFCIQIQSKKHFYKALSAAIRLMPHQEKLWEIGTQYQIEIGKNLWKARKILIRALKLNQNSQKLWFSMLKFQIYFLKTIYLRQKAIQGHQSTLKFIKPNQQEKMQEQLQIGQEMDEQNQENAIKNEKSINLQKHDQIMLIVIQQAVKKIGQRQSKIQMLLKFRIIIKEQINKQKEEFIINVLRKLLNKVEQGIPKSSLNLNDQEQIIKQTQTKRTSSINQKIRSAKQHLANIQNLNNSLINKIVVPFLTKPQILSSMLTPLIESNYSLMINYVSTTPLFKNYLIPHTLIQCFLQFKTQNLSPLQKQYLCSQIKRISIDNLKQNQKLLSVIIQFNKSEKNYKANNDLYRKLSIGCRAEPQILQRCLHLIHNK